MARIHVLFLLLALLASLISASAPTFCKCTCFKNSTIIPLGPNHAPPPSPLPAKPTSTAPSTSAATTSQSSISTQRRAASSSCSQCNRAACLSYNLPFCRDAEEKDVVAMCFQRDSRKDQIIVWCFILGTAGLLGWAAVKRVLEAKGALGVSIPGLGVLRTGHATGRSGGLGSGGVQQRRGGGVGGGSGSDDVARGAYSPIGPVDDR
ncbi:hypothetical protein NKR19_g82 [Coniochaeta hoffmannii]|uniref:MFS transporter n=1 Tax=Coniochaeta hoffmannii TaxID=91930 RepID=A0AA38S3G5_9PEZI|nr:hypothetical protein NKR19_g82 [Coniochaeta hoffmannii]